MLLMSQVFVICVPTDEYQLKSTAATRFEVRPVFRIAKCFSTYIARSALLSHNPLLPHTQVAGRPH